MVHTSEQSGLSTGWAIKHGIGGGVLAGIVFAVAEMVGARLIQGNPFLMPLAAISSVLIGDPPPQVVDEYSTASFVLIGLATHMVLAALFGVIFALFVAKVRAVQSFGAIIVWASVWGLALWVINFYVLAPLIGRPWFTEMAPVQQFVYHTFFFGTVLGIYLAAVRPARE